MNQKLRGDRIRELRKELNLTQYDLAMAVTRLGAELRQSWLSQVEQGRAGLRPDALRLVAAALNTSVDYLVDATDDPTPRDSLEQQVMLLEQNEERREYLREIFNGVAKLPDDIRGQYYDALAALYRGYAIQARARKKDGGKE